MAIQWTEDLRLPDDLDLANLFALKSIGWCFEMPQLVEQCDKRLQTFECERVWEAAPSFRHLCDLDKEFVEGSQCITPYNLGPFEEDNEKFKKGLIKLNEQGFLTLGDGSYSHEKFKIGEGSYLVGPDSVGKWAEEEHRAKLDFAMPGQDDEGNKTQYAKLFQELKATKSILVSAMDAHDFDMVLGSDKKVVNYRSRLAHDESELATNEWLHMGSALELCDAREEPFWGQENMKQWKAVMIRVAAAEWQDVDLPALVLGAVEKSLEFSVAL